MQFRLPITGEQREVVKFMLFPTKINGIIYWLERIKIHQSYNTRKRRWSNDWVADKNTNGETVMCNVYKIESCTCYSGISLVVAENAEEANSFIDSYKNCDTGNYGDSKGYCHVDECDKLEGVFGESKGIIYYGIFYSG